MTTNVTEPRKEYTEMLSGVKRNRAAVGGERPVKAAGVEFLPPLSSMCCKTVDGETIRTANLTPEGQASFNKYLANAYFYGATGRTVDGLNGLIHSKPPVCELPSNLEYIKENSNGKGGSLRVLSSKGTTEAFQTPQSGYLLAMPSIPSGISRADAERLNAVPKIVHYNFESVINWDTEIINNVEMLSLLVLKESTTKRTGFKVEPVDKYRVLELIDGVYNQSLYDSEGVMEQPPAPVIINGSKLDRIPFEWVKVSDGKSVIDDLVDANFQHYNISADYGGKLHYSSFIIYTETGAAADDQNMLIGNGVKWSNPSHEAEFSVLQPDGNADSHRIALQDMEQRMAALGAEQLKPRISGAESAEAKGLDQVAQNSTTANVAITVSNAIQSLLTLANELMGGSGDVTYSLNTDYNPTSMNPQMLTALMGAVQMEGISPETFYENMLKGEIANPDRTFEEEQALIKASNSGLE